MNARSVRLRGLEVAARTPAASLSIALLMAALTAPTLAAPRAPSVPPLEGVVSRVSDGDSLWITPAGRPPIVVRLRDVDAPEICQPWGEEARAALSALAMNKPALLHTRGRDAHGRVLGRVIVDEIDLGRHLVSEGHAWSTRTRFDRGPLVKEERMAKALRRGLHATGTAINPKDFRASHGPCTAEPTGAVPARRP